ncbi:hypothetical protein RHS01_01824 [Rhizoctonia solani]|uniref:Uncharacterized protein n=1 Tax=Rhizoctonia solani TaxID=456999 RepID=A0A8H7IIF0_9AGAM|nr:hypothetical protein RHS01_01824 [Rhizoctonia solani]
MKSLVALLDRKKKDRANALVQVPFPSTLPHSTVNQDGSTSTHGARRTSTPSSFLRPSQQHRTVSDSGHMHRPLLSEPSPYLRDHSPAQNASYYTDSDDSILVDPFAPSPTKLPKPTHDLHHHPCPRRGSEPNAANTRAPSSYRFRSSQEPSTLPVSVDEPPLQSGVAEPPGRKGGWLRERRSLTSLLRSQQPHTPATPVPTVPLLPNRTSERKPSLLFSRTRSGSTPTTAQTAERAHTPRQPSTGLGSIQLPLSANSQSHATDAESKHGAPYRRSVPLNLISPLSLILPTLGRRAVSVPLPPQQSTEPLPPMPNAQFTRHDPKSEADRSAGVSSEPVRMRRPEASTERNSRHRHDGHGMKSALASAPGLEKSSVQTQSGQQTRPTPQHGKQPSVGTSESLALKSALKHRPTETSQIQSNVLLRPVKPLKIHKRETVPSKADQSQLPTPSSESSLNNLHYASLVCKDGARTTTHHKSISGSSLGRSLNELSVDSQGASATEDRPVTSSATSSSFNSIMKGHGLSGSDSRSLPVLDNIWGSFISETAFGGSLPPSPVAPVSAGRRELISQETQDRGRSASTHTNLYSANNSSVLHSENLQKPGSAPPSQPPWRICRRHSSTNATAPLTPPTSPTEETVLQGLEYAMAPSSSANLSSYSRNKSSVSRQHLGPRLARSASSPSIRPSASPEIGHRPTNSHITGEKSYHSSKPQNSRSTLPLRTLQTSLEPIPNPGALVAVLPEVLDLITSDLRESSGPPTTPVHNLRPSRKGSVYTVAPECSAMGTTTQISGPAPAGVPKFTPDMFSSGTIESRLVTGREDEAR